MTQEQKTLFAIEGIISVFAIEQYLDKNEEIMNHNKLLNDSRSLGSLENPTFDIDKMKKLNKVQGICYDCYDCYLAEYKHQVERHNEFKQRLKSQEEQEKREKDSIQEIKKRDCKLNCVSKE